MTELLQYLREVGGLDFVLIFAVAFGVQGFKKSTAGSGWKDWSYMAVGMILASMMAMLKDYGGNAEWTTIAYDAVLYALTSSGVYSYGKQIPILNKFFTTNRG